MAFYNQRAYSRGNHFNCSAKISADGEDWAGIEVFDVSSGGMSFQSAAEYAEGDTLWFDLTVKGFLSEIEVETQGVVRRKLAHGTDFQYGIAFQGLSPEKKIIIDENVNNDRPIEGGGYEAD